MIRAASLEKKSSRAIWRQSISDVPCFAKSSKALWRQHSVSQIQVQAFTEYDLLDTFLNYFSALQLNIHFSCLQLCYIRAIERTYQQLFLSSHDDFSSSTFETPEDHFQLPYFQNTRFLIRTISYITTAWDLCDFTASSYEPSQLDCRHCVERSFRCWFHGAERNC